MMPAMGVLGSIVEMVFGIVVAAGVIWLETRRRAGPPQAQRNTGADEVSFKDRCKKLCSQCGPELVGILIFLAVFATLTANGVIVTENAVEEQAWAEIQKKWPTLVTPDSLLSLQSVLRLVLFTSTFLRAGSAATGYLPLGDEPSALFLGAMFARCYLLVISEDYLLDGPLGGKLPGSCEIASGLLLLALALSQVKKSFVTTMAMFASAVWFSSRNYLSLSEDSIANSLFTLAHTLELLASFAYVCRTLMIATGPTSGRKQIHVGLTHILMAVQQALSTYYFLQAFDESPELVGAGRPFVLLKVGNCAQLGAYVGALALYSAELSDGVVEADSEPAPRPAGTQHSVPQHAATPPPVMNAQAVTMF